MKAAGPMRSAPFSSTPWETPLGANSSVIVVVRRWFQTSSNQRLKSWILDSDMLASYNGCEWDSTTRVDACEVDLGSGLVAQEQIKGSREMRRERRARLIYLR